MQGGCVGAIRRQPPGVKNECRNVSNLRACYKSSSIQHDVTLVTVGYLESNRPLGQGYLLIDTTGM